MHNELVTVNSRNYDLSLRRSWKCVLAERLDSLLVFTGEFETDIHHADLGFIRRGTKSYEYYWLDRWYNVFRFHEPDGAFRNFYCNINMPPEFEHGILDYIDLDIDVIVGPNFDCKVVDLEEFEMNTAKFKYPADVISNAENALTEVLGTIKRREFPFDNIYSTQHLV